MVGSCMVSPAGAIFPEPRDAGGVIFFELGESGGVAGFGGAALLEFFLRGVVGEDAGGDYEGCHFGGGLRLRLD